MKHYLNVCDVDGGAVAPVDIITFGSPCQDLSVAGKRAGLKHESIGDDETTRSGLFMEAVRIIREMREKTDGEYPKWALWENVPGALSSNSGDDFRVVIEELAKIIDKTVSIPEPPKGKWPTAGYVELDNGSIAWRIVDAQYTGVPQRRRRILLVTDFTGQRAGEVLFKCEGLPGYPAEGGEEGQTAASDAQGCAGTDDINECPRSGNGVSKEPIALDREAVNAGYNLDRTPGIDESGIAYTLKATGPGSVCYEEPVGFDGYNASLTGDVSSTIGVNCGMSTGRNGVMEPIGVDLYNQAITGNVSKPMTASATDSDHVPCVVEPIGLDSYNLCTTGDVARTIATPSGGLNEHIPCVIEGNGARPSHKGDGYKESEVMYTLNTTEQHAVAYGICSYDSNSMKSGNPDSGIYEADTSRTLDLNGGNPACNQGGIAIVEPVDKAYTLKIRGGVAVDSSGKGAGKGALIQTEKSATIGVSQDQYLFQPTNEPIVLESNQNHATVNQTGICNTLPAAMGMGGGYVPMVTQPTACYDARGNGDGETVPTITGDHENRITDYTAVAIEKVETVGSGLDMNPVSHTLVASMVNAATGSTQDNLVVTHPMNWDGTQTAGTLTANNAGGNQRMPDKDNFNCVLDPIACEVFHCESEKDKTMSLKARDYKDPTIVAYGVDCRNFNESEEVFGTLQAKPNGGQSLNYSGAVHTHYIVRRLTPTECARLQGFPDDWGHLQQKDDMTDEEVEFWREVFITHQMVVNGKKREEVQHRVETKKQILTWYNKLWTDGAEYKMWGNGVALPCVRLPIHNMAKLGAKTMASLFDGSGGFPLAGVLEGIEPVWCSEIEPYPIAVTVERFPEKN